MRKIIVLTFISLDGVMQAPGGPEEDTSGGFKYGGWSAPFADEASGKAMQKQMEATDILLGRKTFEIFAGYWPQHADYWPGINEVKKYVLSNTIDKSDPIAIGWQNCEFLTSVEDIKKLKNSEGSDLKVWGSGELVKLLLKHDLADELWLKIYPVLLGKGKTIYSDDTIPAAFKLTESTVTPSGVIFANYARNGEVTTGSFGD
jgi:dihydrofolate reductase